MKLTYIAIYIHHQKRTEQRKKERQKQKIKLSFRLSAHTGPHITSQTPLTNKMRVECNIRGANRNFGHQLLQLLQPIHYAPARHLNWPHCGVCTLVYSCHLHHLQIPVTLPAECGQDKLEAGKGKAMPQQWRIEKGFFHVFHVLSHK
jgi:hypothetical protein